MWLYWQKAKNIWTYCHSRDMLRREDVARYTAPCVGSWTATWWEFCSFSRLWTAVWHWEGPSTALLPLGISAGFIQAWLSFLSAAGRHLEGGGVKEGEEVLYSFLQLLFLSSLFWENEGSTFMMKCDFIFLCTENGRIFCTDFTFFLAWRKH